MGDIAKMFNPKTVALVGDTGVEGTVERTLLNNLLTSNQYKLFLVNSRHGALDKEREAKKSDDPGMSPGGTGSNERPEPETYDSIASVPVKIDLAVIATPAQTVPAIVEACGKAGAEGVIVISAGFKETGEEGKKREDEIREIRKHYGMRILGPNCAGIIKPDTGLNASIFALQPAQGNMAFITQSASLGSAMLDWAATAHVGFSMFVSLGSMIDIDFGDLIDFLGEDPKTRSIMLYMEAVGNARKFMGAARGFARNKPIIVVKPGLFGESAQASLSHTGAMAGSDAAYDVAFRRAGVVRVREISDLFNAAEVLRSRILPGGPRLAIITNAGGPGVIATDALVGLGGESAKLSEATIDGLSAILPPYWSKSNPVDLFGDADVDRYVKAIDLCVNDQGVDGILVIYASHKTAKPIELADALIKIGENARKPLVTVLMGAKDTQKARELLKQKNILSYETPEEAISTYLYMYSYRKNLDLLYETPEEMGVDQAPPKYHLKALVRRILREERRVLSEAESKDFLKNYGIPITIPLFAHSSKSAATLAQRIGYPVVLKVVSPNITHRSDVGGIASVHSEDRLEDEYRALLARVQENAPEALIAGVTVEQMIQNVDYQLVLGTKKDKDFGSIIFFGIGGKDAQVFDDRSYALPPLNQTLARLLMNETKVSRLLKGFRAKKPTDVRELEHIIVSFSNLIVDFPEISEIEINPIVIANGKTYAVNARAILEESPPSDPGIQYPHLVISPYPTRYVSRWNLSDGTEVLLRPIRPEDEPLEYELLTSLSQSSMQRRFFSIINDISHEMLLRYCNIDYDREVAIVAEIKVNGVRRLIGIGRLILRRELNAGEFAVVVHDNYQGKGLGYKLVDLLIGIGEEKRLGFIYGEVLTENRNMIGLCRNLGFTIEPSDDYITKVSLTLH